MIKKIICLLFVVAMIGDSMQQGSGGSWRGGAYPGFGFGPGGGAAGAGNGAGDNFGVGFNAGASQERPPSMQQVPGGDGGRAANGVLGIALNAGVGAVVNNGSGVGYGFGGNALGKSVSPPGGQAFSSNASDGGLQESTGSTTP